MSRRIYITAAAAVIFLTAAAAVYFHFDPAEAAWMPQCIFRRLTGLQCPGCGSQRFLHAILHGDIHAALRANALLLPLIPYLFFWGAVEISPSRNQRLRRALNSIPAIISILAIIIIWGVARNIFDI